MEMKEDNFNWIDENNNKLFKFKYSKEEAIEIFESLDRCYDCINCINCYDCNNCISCINCLSCNDCKNCFGDIDCKKCVWCDNCTREIEKQELLWGRNVRSLGMGKNNNDNQFLGGKLTSKIDIAEEALNIYLESRNIFISNFIKQDYTSNNESGLLIRGENKVDKDNLKNKMVMYEKLTGLTVKFLANNDILVVVEKFMEETI